MIPPHILVCVTAFLLSFGTTLAYHATPFFAFDHLAGDARMSGNFGAAQSIAYVITSLLSVRIIARTKRGFDLAMFGTGLFVVTYGLVPFVSAPWVCIAMSAVGLSGMALTWPAFHSWMGGEPDPVKRARHMSWLNIGWSSGCTVSPLVAGPLYDMDFHYPFYGAMAICILVVILLRVVPHEKAHFGEASQEMLDARADHDRAAVRFLWPAWLSVIVFHALNGSMRNVYPKRIAELVEAGQLRWLGEATATHFLSHNPATIFAVLAFALGGGIAVAFYFMGRTQMWKHRFIALLLPQLAAMAAVYALATTHSLVAMSAACGVIGAGLGVCFFSCSYYCLADPALKHRRCAINEGMVGVGALIGNLAFGQSAAALGTTTPFLFAPVGIAGLAVVEFIALRISRKVNG